MVQKLAGELFYWGTSDLSTVHLNGFQSKFTWVLA
uniref:Uncharacterized protein n=1 Tax=Rhizophora mucronata TaxID=61149 RepID=A0A2P2NGE8_RHIMU